MKNGVRRSLVLSMAWAAILLVSGLQFPQLAASQTAASTADQPFDAISAAATLAALNQSATALLAVTTNTCASTSVPQGSAAQFGQDCLAASTALRAATADLGEASSLVGEAAVGQAGANLTQYSVLVSGARTNLGQASSKLVTISTFTYAGRASAFVDGPLAQRESSANAAVASQTALSARLMSTSASFLSFAAEQGRAVQAVINAASSASVSTGSFQGASVNSSISAEESVLAAAESNLTLMSQQLPSLPAVVLSSFRANVTATQSALNGCGSSLSTISLQTAQLRSVTVASFGTYAVAFQSDLSTSEAECQASASAYATLEAQLGSLASEYPLLTALSQWSSTIGSLGKEVSAQTSATDGSFQAASASLSSIASATQALTNSVQSPSGEVQVSPAALQNISSVYSSEGQFLNSSGLASLQNASVSLQGTSQNSAAFYSAAQSLLGTYVTQLSTPTSLLQTNGGSLTAETHSTALSLQTAAVYVSADLAARTATTSQASTLVSEALSDFGAQQVTQGAALLEQASAEFSSAASPSH